MNMNINENLLSLQMTALSVGYIQTYRDSVDSLGESVDMSIKVRVTYSNLVRGVFNFILFSILIYVCLCMCFQGMYTLMARCEELDRSMQPIHTLAAQIRDIKRTLDALETICK